MPLYFVFNLMKASLTALASRSQVIIPDHHK